MVKISVTLHGDPKNYVVTDNGAIAGQIVVDTKAALDAELFTVRFNGKSICSWSEGSGNDSRSYYSKEIIIDRTMNIVTAETGYIVSHIPPGRTIYPFTFFNNSLPSTLQGGLGNIHYSVNVILKPRGHRSAIKVKKPIKLTSQLRNIYYFPSQRIRTGSKMVTKKLCCVPLGSASATVTLQHSPHILGESCLVRLDVNNNLRGSLTPKVKLKRYTVYYASGSARKVKEDVTAQLGEPIPGETVNCVRSMTLSMDKDVATPPFRTGNIISTYCLVVKLIGEPKLRFMFSFNDNVKIPL